MTKIIFYKFNNKIIGFECSGHANFGEFGSDILCASISSITQAAVLGISKVVGIKADYIKDDENGYLKVVIPEKISQKELEQSEVILRTAFVALNDLKSGYPKHIKIEEKSYVY